MATEDDNRKRNFQEDDLDSAISSKRAALGISTDPIETTLTSGEESFYFKLLCPQFISGLIIGKGGSIINQLNSTCGAKIKLSQNSEFFPGANERILVLYGPREGLANAVKELVTRICEATDKRPPNTSKMVDMYGNPVASNRGYNGTFQVRLLIPKIASGTLIGKSGSVIKQMAEISGSKMQLGDESDPYDTKERGVQTLMAQLLSEPKVRTYQNTGSNYGPMGVAMTPPSPQMPYRPVMGMIPQMPPQAMPPQAMGGMPGMYGQQPQQGYQNRMPVPTPYSSTPMTMYPQGYAPYQPK